MIKDYLIDPVKHEVVYCLQDFEGGVYLADKCRQASFLFTEIKDESPILSNQLQKFSKQLDDERRKLKNTPF